MDIYLTLDYELFLNDITGDVDHCLITPGDELLKVLNKHDVKATFFVDMAYAYRLKELQDTYDGLKEDYIKFSNHVKKIANAGHTIGLHLHPQWFYSTFDGNTWTVDMEHYKLADMPLDEANERFDICYKMLTDIVGTKVTSFRAGGFSIQTFKGFPDALLRNGITNDSSATFRGRVLSKLHYFDYSSLKDSDHFRFEDDILKPNENGCMTEWVISSGKRSYISYCIQRTKYHALSDNYNWGNGGDLPSKSRIDFIKNAFRKLKWNVVVGATIDYQSFFHLELVYKSYKNAKNKDFVILGHPKNLSPASLRYLDEFISKVKNESKFKTIR